MNKKLAPVLFAAACIATGCYTPRPATPSPLHKTLSEIERTVADGDGSHAGHLAGILLPRLIAEEERHDPTHRASVRLRDSALVTLRQQHDVLAATTLVTIDTLARDWEHLAKALEEVNDRTRPKLLLMAMSKLVEVPRGQDLLVLHSREIVEDLARRQHTREFLPSPLVGLWYRRAALLVSLHAERGHADEVRRIHERLDLADSERFMKTVRSVATRLALTDEQLSLAISGAP